VIIAMLIVFLRCRYISWAMVHKNSGFGSYMMTQTRPPRK